MALKAVLGKREVFALAFGAIVGWGWVVLSGTLIADAGSIGSILAFVVGGVLVGFVGLTYAELTAALPRTGGEIAFAYRALGSGWSWLCGWALILAYVGVCAFEAVALATVLDYVWPGVRVGRMYSVAGSEVYASWVGIGVGATLLIAVVNWLGMRTSARLQTAGTLGLLAVGLSFVGISQIRGDTANLTPYFTGWEGFLAAVTVTPFLLIGFDVIPQTAEEIKLPSADIGRTILLAVVMAVLWYAAIQWSVGLALPAIAVGASRLPTAEAATEMFGSTTGGRLLVAGGVLGILTSWNAFFVGATRLVLGMARSGLLPPFLKRLHIERQTPTGAILFLTACTLAAPWLGRHALGWIANAASLAAVTAFLLVAVSFSVLRLKAPELGRPYRVRAGGFVGAGAVVASLAFVGLYLPPSPSALQWPFEWGIILSWVALGIVVFAAGTRSRRAMSDTDRARIMLGPYAGSGTTVTIARD